LGIPPVLPLSFTRIIRRMSSRAEEFANCLVFSPDQVLFPDISYASFAYPGDEEALAALEHIPGAPGVLSYLQQHLMEDLAFAEHNQEMVRASSSCYKSLHQLVVRCSEILSCPVPDVYISQNPEMNAESFGHRHTHIVLRSSLIEGLTADEVTFIIGHELGHLKCGHGLYRQLGAILVDYWEVVASQIPIPGLDLLRTPLLFAYWEWFRRAEFSCDRAGFMCLQTLPPALSALAKLSGKVEGFDDELDIDSVTSQATANRTIGKLARLIFILDSLENTHPFVPQRLKQLTEYSRSVDYEQIVRGQYIHDPLGLHEAGRRVHCSSCGKEVNSKFACCPNCGQALSLESPITEMTCKQCSNVLTADARFCPRCGSKQENFKEPKSFNLFRRKKQN
jgi:Zn-dependent protease with chaperone function/RNA polymerase subunit RPABC4/transcription elongation factor Spt4